MLTSPKQGSIVFLAALCTVVVAAVVIASRRTDVAEPLHQHDRQENPYRSASLSVELIAAPNGTFGYTILTNGRVLIHQPHIPALPGNEGFRSEEDARRVAQFVIEKIRKNIFPPSTSLEELDSLGVAY